MCAFVPTAASFVHTFVYLCCLCPHTHVQHVLPSRLPHSLASKPLGLRRIRRPSLSPPPSRPWRDCRYHDLHRLLCPRARPERHRGQVRARAPRRETRAAHPSSLIPSLAVHLLRTSKKRPEMRRDEQQRVPLTLAFPSHHPPLTRASLAGTVFTLTG